MRPHGVARPDGFGAELGQHDAQRDFVQFGITLQAVVAFHEHLDDVDNQQSEPEVVQPEVYQTLMRLLMRICCCTRKLIIL